MESMVLDSALAMHDHLMLHAPADARHDSDLCPFCRDWAMSHDGIPSGLDRLELADAKKPYGDVEYADPGFQKDGKKRYPIDTEAHARAAWSYLHQASNASNYNEDQLSKIRSKIAAAMKKFGAEMQDDPQPKVAGASNSAKNQPKKAEKAGVDYPQTGSDAKPGAQTGNRPDAAARGGKHMETETVETLSKETHEALLAKAVTDATASMTSERDDLARQVTSLTEQLNEKSSALEQASTENERLNGELDTAQVSLKAAQDEAEALKKDAHEKEEAARVAELASLRASQVRNLSLFTEEFITERASKWAEISDDAWGERLDEWKVAKGTSTTKTTETASAITGTRDTQSGQQASARRAALGLTTE